jgi:YteA family regulatory protein
MICFLNSFLVIPYFPIFSSPFHTQIIITNFSGELGDESTFFSKNILPFMFLHISVNTKTCTRPTKGLVEMLSNQQIQQFRQGLEDRKAQLEEEFENNDHFNLQRSLSDSVSELSVYDNHPGDAGTELYEREKDLALNEHYRLEYRNVLEAIEAIDKGTYGICAVCHKEIPVERLEALPNTLYCIEHSPDKVTSHERPIEEGVLMPPFGKFDMDETDENVSYDAEDSWQDVASYGTSESPSDQAEQVDHYNDMYIEPQENVGYVEDYENFVGVDITGKHVTVYPNKQHEKYEEELDEEGIMTTFGDLPAFEHDPYVEEHEEREEKEEKGQ